MKFLLDTRLLLWAAGEPLRLSAAARKLLSDERNELLFSPASLWEVVIKSTLGRADFQVEASQLRRGLLDNGYHELAITGPHVLAVQMLPNFHRDPFDRLLIGQAFAEGITLLTVDPLVAKYRGTVRRV